MKEKSSILGKDLATKLRHTGRMMPKHIKHEVAYWAEVCVLVKNPKLSRMIDHKQVEAAHLACVTFLQTVDVVDRRKGVWLGVLGSLTLALMTGKRIGFRCLVLARIPIRIFNAAMLAGRVNVVRKAGLS